MAFVITGYMPSDIGPKSAYFMRNVPEDQVAAQLEHAREQGWTNLDASEEAF